MEKSYVSIEKKLCLCCGKEKETNSLLLDKRLKNSMERFTTTGYSICSDCKKDGYILLIGIDETRSTITENTIKPENAYRTGNICHIKEDLFSKIFNTEIPKGKFAFVQDEVITILSKKEI